MNPFPAYLDLVKQQLQISYSSAELSRRGLRVFTAFDPLVQRNLETVAWRRDWRRFDAARAAGRGGDRRLPERRHPGAWSAIASPIIPGFNRALMAQRPIGSLIKPLLLYSLLQNDLTLASKSYAINPFASASRMAIIWEPRNYDRELHGDMTPLPGLYPVL